MVGPPPKIEGGRRERKVVVSAPQGAVWDSYLKPPRFCKVRQLFQNHYYLTSALDTVFISIPRHKVPDLQFITKGKSGAKIDCALICTFGILDSIFGPHSNFAR